MHGKALSLSCYVIVIFEQLIPFIKGSFSRVMLHEITGIIDALKNKKSVVQSKEERAVE